MEDPIVPVFSLSNINSMKIDGIQYVNDINFFVIAPGLYNCHWQNLVLS